MVFTVQTGADSARLLKQWYSFGFKDQIPLLASQNVTDQSVTDEVYILETGQVVHHCSTQELVNDSATLHRYLGV